MPEHVVIHVEIRRSGNGQYRGRIFDHPVEGLPAEIGFTATEAPSRPTEEGPRTAFTFSEDGVVFIGKRRGEAVEHFTGPILLAMTLLGSLERNGTPPQGPLRIPYAPPAKFVYRPVELALRLNGMIS